ncbi:MAG: hypothetical protein ABIQ40_03150 [Bacteroidia bacterium]
MTSHTKYFLRYSIFLALIAAALYFWNESQPVQKVHPLSWGIFGFFAVLFFFLHLFLLNAEDKKPGVFVRRFMAVSTIRLFVLVMIMVIYSLLQPLYARSFLLHFLVFYFAFAIFEIASLYHHFKPKT